MLRLIDRFHDLPALVTSAKGDVLAWNAMSSALHGDWSRLRAGAAQPAAAPFLPDPTDPPRSSVGGTPDERAATAAQTVAHLRSVAGRYPDDRGPGPAARGPPRGSAEFRELWADIDAGGWRSHTKTVTHPSLGELTLECDSLHVPDVDQSLIVYSAAPGSARGRGARPAARGRHPGPQHGPLIEPGELAQPPQRGGGGGPALGFGPGHRVAQRQQRRRSGQRAAGDQPGGVHVLAGVRRGARQPLGREERRGPGRAGRLVPPRGHAEVGQQQVRA